MPFVTHNGIKYLEGPATEAEFWSCLDENYVVTVVLPVSLQALVDGDIESLNDIADEMIVPPDMPGVLPDHTILIKVCADASGVDEE